MCAAYEQQYILSNNPIGRKQLIKHGLRNSETYRLIYVPVTGLRSNSMATGNYTNWSVYSIAYRTIENP